MRSYDQYCGLARALDVVGDRWTLLIVRELLIHDGARYTDLRRGLPGIATNLLADRLRELEANGIVSREEAPPPVATTLFRLTTRGEALRPVVEAIGQWGQPLLAGTAPDAEFRSHWLVLPLERMLADHAPAAPPITIQLLTGDQPMLVETVDGRVAVRPGTAEQPTATLEGPPGLVMEVLVHRLDLATARRRGLRVRGEPAAVQRVAPAAVDSSDVPRAAGQALAGG